MDSCGGKGGLDSSFNILLFKTGFSAAVCPLPCGFPAKARKKQLRDSFFVPPPACALHYRALPVAAWLYFAGYTVHPVQPVSPSLSAACVLRVYLPPPRTTSLVQRESAGTPRPADGGRRSCSAAKLLRTVFSAAAQSHLPFFE